MKQAHTKRSTFWSFMDDSGIDQNVKKVFIYSFAMTFFRREARMISPHLREVMAEQLMVKEPDDILKELLLEEQCIARDKMLFLVRRLIARCGTN